MAILNSLSELKMVISTVSVVLTGRQLIFLKGAWKRQCRDLGLIPGSATY